MNKKGHAQTLVAAHPENRNAVKAGVFSPATLAPRVADLEVAIAERRPDEAVRDLLRRELAALAALAEAMDESLASAGVLGPNDQARSLISLRLRANEKLRRTAEHYAVVEAMTTPEVSDAAAGQTDDPATNAPPISLIDCIASQHGRDSITELRPNDLDPEAYFAAVIVATDPAVTTRDRLRARQLLTKQRKSRAQNCVCFSTLRARDEIEFRAWIDEIRQTREPARHDGSIAAVVRRVAAGERLEPRSFHRKMIEATNEVIADGVLRARDGELRGDERVQSDATLAPFWAAALSPNRAVRAKERLDALAVLDKADALPQCTCDPEPEHQLIEKRIDAWYAYTIRLVAQKHYRAALHVAWYPETYLAIRDAIDAEIVAALASSDEDGPSPEA